MRRIQAVLFDLDGLMVRSEPLSLKAWQQLLAEFGYTLSEEEYPELIGIDGDATVNVLRRWMDLPMSNGEIINLHYEYWIAIVKAEVQPVDGLFDLVEAVQARDLEIGIASNSRSDYVHCVLDTIGLNGNFKCVVASDHVERGKPAPDVYEAAAGCLGVETVDCLALEDSPAGLQSAITAGMRCVVVPNHDLLDERYDGAYACFPSLSALVAELDRVLS